MLKKFIKDLRNIEICLGSKTKIVTTSEKKNMKIFRKSIFATSSIKKDDIIKIHNITFKRPGYGISPKNLKILYQLSHLFMQFHIKKVILELRLTVQQEPEG